MRRPDERGSSTVWGATGAVILLLVGSLAALLAGVVARQHQVDAAADLAALSAAAVRQRGQPACAAAAEIAADNSVELMRCRTEGEDVVVEVRADLALPLGMAVALHGIARAGPE